MTTLKIVFVFQKLVPGSIDSNWMTVKKNIREHMERLLFDNDVDDTIINIPEYEINDLKWLLKYVLLNKFDETIHDETLYNIRKIYQLADYFLLDLSQLTSHFLTSTGTTPAA